VLVLEGELDGGEFLGRSLGEGGDGAVLDLAVPAVGLAEEEAGVDLAA
jgi:hypothetical protein